MEASVAGGIPIHAVLREGISGDRIVALYGILNGTSNYILTEMEKHGTPLDIVLAEAQKLGYAEADPTNDVEGFDARSKLAILSALAFGEKITPTDIFAEGIRRLSPVDFQYAHRLGHTIRLLCAARQTEDGLMLSVRPALISTSTILASVQGSYNAIWVKGLYGEDTFYYGRGAGPNPTGVAIVSDLMRVAREIRDGSPERVSPFAHKRLGQYKPISVTRQKRAYYLRFRVNDREGIMAALAGILAANTSAWMRCCRCPAKPSTICPLSSPSNRPPNKPFARQSKKSPDWIFSSNRRSPCRLSHRSSLPDRAKKAGRPRRLAGACDDAVSELYWGGAGFSAGFLGAAPDLTFQKSGSALTHSSGV